MTAAAVTAAYPTAVRLEQAVQNLIMAVIAIAAGASAFTHVRDLSISYGLPEWQGWANAIVIELLAVAAGLELRRRRRSTRAGAPGTAFPVGVLIVAVIVSLACQVAEAHPSPWGWTLSAVPALGLLAIVKLVLGRTPDPAPDPAAGPAPAVVPVPAPVPDRAAQGQPPASDRGPGTSTPDRTAVLVPGPPVRTSAPVHAAPVHRSQVRVDLPGPDPVRTIAERLARDLPPGQTLTRRAIAEAVRAEGHSIGTARAGELARQFTPARTEGGAPCPSPSAS